MSKFKNIENISLRDFVKECRLNANNHGWYVRWEKLGDDKEVFDVPTALMLIVTELSEAMEEYRDNNKEEFSVEMADVFIRLCHLCGDLDIDIERVMKTKMLINEARPYHHGRKVF